MFVLCIEYETVTVITEKEDDGIAEEIVSHKSICYYVMSNICVGEEKASFERPDVGIQQHLKPLDYLGKGRCNGR